MLSFPQKPGDSRPALAADGHIPPYPDEIWPVEERYGSSPASGMMGIISRGTLMRFSVACPGGIISRGTLMRFSVACPGGIISRGTLIHFSAIPSLMRDNKSK